MKKTDRTRPVVGAGKAAKGTVGPRPFPAALSYGMVIVAAFVAFGSSLHFGVTAFDDDKILGIFSGGPHRLSDALLSNAFMERRGQDFYRPLQSLSFMADAAWSGGPARYHLTNLLIHALTACCLLRLFVLLGFGRRRSLVAALLFAVHPMFAQAVAWIPGRGDLLLGLFGTLSFTALVHYRQTGRLRDGALATAALLPALLAKENAIVLPFLFIAYMALFDRKKAVQPRNLLLGASWIAVCLAYAALRREAMSGTPGGDVFGLVPLLDNIRTLPETLTWFFFPFDIPVMPSFTAAPTVAGLAAALLIAAALVARGRPGRPLALFGTLWFVALLLPGMMYRQLLGAHAFTYLNHRSYLPMVGLLIVLLEAVPETGGRTSRRGVAAAGACMVALLCLLANRQDAFFADPAAFYNQAIRTNPHSAFALNNRASLRSEAGDVSGAIRDMDAALRLEPDFPACLLNRGILSAFVGDTESACRGWRRAAALGNAMAEEMAGRYCR
jgi:tetratricopeptide (TPR) repeat protein